MMAGTRAFFARHPLFASAVVMVAGISAMEVSGKFWPWGLLPLVLGPLIAGWRLGGVCAVAGLLAGLILDARHGTRDELVSQVLEVRSREAFELKMLEDARAGRTTWSGTARVVAAGDSADTFVGSKVLLYGGGDVLPVAGTRLLVRGDFLPPRIARNPGNFDEVSWLRREGLVGVLRAQRGKIQAHTSAFSGWRAGVRQSFRRSITVGLDEESQAARVIRAVVMGEHPRDSAELIDAFRHSGTMHVFCVSGLHVGMVGLLGWCVLGLAGVPRRWAVAAIIPLMFGYTWLTGSGAPAVRASCMAAVFLGAFVLQRRPDALNALGAVMSLTLLWDGRMLFQPGVQLSYGVVMAIIIGATLAARIFKWISREDAHLPQDEYGRIRKCWLWLRRRTAQSLAVSAAAWGGSTPLTVYHFGLITPASIPATVVQIPIVFCLLGAALVSALLHPVAPWASRGINHANAALANACVGVARGFAAAPGGYIRIDGRGGERLIVFDLPYGDGAAVFSGMDGATLIDCGSGRSFRSHVLSSLRRQGIYPDSVILTHPDGGHLGGGSPVWESLPVRQILLPVAEARSPAYRAWVNDAPVADVRTGFAKSGDRFQVGHDAWIEVVREPSHVSPRARADDRVMILRLHWRGWRILFTSDAGLATERHLLESGADVVADVIVAGKHASDLHLGDDFLDAVAPLAIIASNAEFPSEQKLDAHRIDYWRSTGIHVIDPLQTGAAILSVDRDGALRIRGFVDGTEITLERPPQ
jgi:competence protein ComEC